MKNQNYDVGINSVIFAMSFAFIGYCELCLTLGYLKKFNSEDYDTAKDSFGVLLMAGIIFEYGLYFLVARVLTGITYTKMLNDDKDYEDRICLKLMYQLT